MIESACRGCAHGPLKPVLTLGKTPLANQLLADEKGKSETYPLDLAFCERCSLVQILETIPPDELFTDYVYFSSFSDGMLAHAKELAERTTRGRKLGPESLVVEIASNDGYLLQHYVNLGIRVLGIEPARNIASVARDRGISTLTEFFGNDLADRLGADGLRASVIHANNVLAHVPAPNQFVEGIHALLTEDGIALIEVPYVREMVERFEFDTIYHEHVFYFSLTALVHLFSRNRLQIVDVERIALHGGSLLVHVARPGRSPATERVSAMLQEEKAIGLDSYAYYEDFSQSVRKVREELRGLLFDLKSKGHKLAAYGAAAKGSTLLNYAGIGSETLSFVVDRSPHKQGKFMPGVRIPIESPEALLRERPDFVLLLAWNFKEEILRQQSAYRNVGGKFIIPLPSPAIE